MYKQAEIRHKIDHDNVVELYRLCQLRRLRRWCSARAFVHRYWRADYPEWDWNICRVGDRCQLLMFLSGRESVRAISPTWCVSSPKTHRSCQRRWCHCSFGTCLLSRQDPRPLSLEQPSSSTSSPRDQDIYIKSSLNPQEATAQTLS